MPVPKKKHSYSRKMSRRAQHDKLDTPNLTTCPDCGAYKAQHRVCGTCGKYKGMQVLEVPPLE